MPARDFWIERPRSKYLEHRFSENVHAGRDSKPGIQGGWLRGIGSQQSRATFGNSSSDACRIDWQWLGPKEQTSPQPSKPLSVSIPTWVPSKTETDLPPAQR